MNHNILWLSPRYGKHHKSTNLHQSTALQAQHDLQGGMQIASHG